MKTGVKLIAEERARQISKEGWSAEHDDAHTDESLAVAGACYALTSSICDKEIWDTPLLDKLWPWSIDSWNPDRSRVRNLAKAGALIAAEIDRIQRGNNP